MPFKLAKQGKGQNSSKFNHEVEFLSEVKSLSLTPEVSNSSLAKLLKDSTMSPRPNNLKTSLQSALADTASLPHNSIPASVSHHPTIKKASKTVSKLSATSSKHSNRSGIKKNMPSTENFSKDTAILSPSEAFSSRPLTARFADFDEDLLPNSPYLRCLLDVLKIDGNKIEITKTQNEIVRRFESLTGINCGKSKTNTNKDGSVNLENMDRFYQNFKSQSNKTSSADIPPKKANAMRKPTAESLHKNQTSTPTAVRKASEGSVLKKKPPVSSARMKKVEKKKVPVPERISEIREVLDLFPCMSNSNPNIPDPHMLPKNWSEEIRNYFGWRSFCLVRRYGNNPVKLEEEMKLLDKEFAKLPDGAMTVPSVVPRAATSLTELAKARKSVSDSVSHGRPAKSKTGASSKTKARNAFSASILQNDEMEEPSKLCPTPSNNSLMSSSSQLLKKQATGRKQKPLSKKNNKLGFTKTAKREAIPNPMLCNLNPYDVPASWELSGILKIATVYVSPEQEATMTKSKLKSRFTIKNEKLEQLKLSR